MLSPHELSALLRVRDTGSLIDTLDDDLVALRHYRLVEMIDEGEWPCALRLTGLGEHLLKCLGTSGARPG